MENTRNMPSGKMSRERSTVTTERTSEQSLKNSSTSLNRQPRCLRLIKDGQKQIILWETDGVYRTDYLTYNTGDAPSVGVESTLSSLLETNVPERYLLSARACQGILARSQRRGKPLPDALMTALTNAIERERERMI